MCVDVVQNIFQGLKTKYYNRNPVSMNKDKLAAYYFYNHNLSYGPMFLGWYSSLFNDHKKYIAAIERVRDFKAPTLQVEEGNFDGVIDSHKNEFLYLDPPYFLEKDDDTIFKWYSNNENNEEIAKSNVSNLLKNFKL